MLCPASLNLVIQWLRCSILPIVRWKSSALLRELDNDAPLPTSPERGDELRMLRDTKPDSGHIDVRYLPQSFSQPSTLTKPNTLASLLKRCDNAIKLSVKCQNPRKSRANFGSGIGNGVWTSLSVSASESWRMPRPSLGGRKQNLTNKQRLRRHSLINGFGGSLPQPAF